MVDKKTDIPAASISNSSKKPACRLSSKGAAGGNAKKADGQAVASPEAALRMLDEMQQKLSQLERLNEELRKNQAELEASRERCEEALASERNLLQTLINLMPGRIFAKDKECRFTLNNNAHLNALGAHSQSEAIGKTDHDFKPASFADRHLADDLKVMENDEPIYEYNEPTHLASGETGTLLVSKVPLHNSAGEVIGLVGMSRDITERMRAEESIRRSVEIQTVLREIAETAALSSSLDELCRAVHRLVGRVLPSDNFNIVLLNETVDSRATNDNPDSTGAVPQRKTAASYMTEYVMLQRRAMYVTSAEFGRLREAGDIDSQSAEIKEWLGAPLIDSQGKVFGAVTLYSLSEKQLFQQADIEVLSVIAAQVSLAVVCKQLEEELRRQATTDGLTGLLNRRHFLARADEELQRVHRYGGTCALLMVDLDNFKLVNDSFGHAAGDTVLQQFTAICKGVTRGTDLLGRVGGDEFAVFLQETGISEAGQIAERLRQVIQNTVFGKEAEHQISLSVSIGVAEYQNKKESFSELMMRTDKAMYRAKSEGRNRVVGDG